MSIHFDCFACYGTQPIEFQVPVADYSVCRGCFIEGVKPNFIAAFQSETNYPVRSANMILNIDDYGAFFTPEFLTAYKIKIEEYVVPIKQRLYCKNTTQTTQADSTVSHAICGEFLGKKPATEEGENASILCSRCSVYICVCCAHKIVDILGEHKCATPPTTDAFEGQELGRDYQVCPNEDCEAKINLREACNHMTCALCQTEFCYVCGDKAAGLSGHWDFGKPCPQYGREQAADDLLDEEAPWEVDAAARREDADFATNAILLLGEGTFENLPEYLPFLGPPIAIGELLGHQAALGLAIRTSPNGNLIELYNNDREQLRIAWSRFVELRMDRPALRSLIRVLHVHIDVYVMRLRRNDRQQRQEVPGDETIRRRVQELVAELGEDGFGPDFTDVARIVETCNQAWLGNFDFLSQRLNDIEEMEQLIDDHLQDLDTIFPQVRERFQEEAFFDDIDSVIMGLETVLRDAYSNLLSPEEQHIRELGLDDLHDIIVQAAARIPSGAWRDMEPLRVVFGTFLNAWNRVVDDRGRVVRPAPFVAEQW